MDRIETELSKYSRILPSLVVDLEFPLIIDAESRVQHFGFIEHLMVKAQDSLILLKRRVRLLVLRHVFVSLVKAVTPIVQWVSRTPMSV